MNFTFETCIVCGGVMPASSDPCLCHDDCEPIWRMCFTSVADAKYAVAACDDLDILSRALDFERGNLRRRTMIEALSNRINKLKKAVLAHA